MHGCIKRNGEKQEGLGGKASGKRNKEVLPFS